MIWNIILIWFFGCLALAALYEVFVYFRNKVCGYDITLLKIEEEFKARYPERHFISARFLGRETKFEMYGVMSTPQKLMKGGGTWNYFKFFPESERIEELEVKKGEKYWKTPSK